MQYGTIRKYSIKTIIEWKLSSSSSLNIDPKQQNQQIRSTIVMKCLNRLQWNNDHSKQQQQQRQQPPLINHLNGQKFLAIISDFHLGPHSFDSSSSSFNNNDNDGEDVDDNNAANVDDDDDDENNWISSIKNQHYRLPNLRSKRSVYHYLKHLWKDFRHLLLPDNNNDNGNGNDYYYGDDDNVQNNLIKTTKTIRNTFDDDDDDMIISMKNEIKNNHKCYYNSDYNQNNNNKYWQDNTDKNSKYFHYKFIKNSPIISNINNDNDDDINVNMEHGCIDCVNPFSKISLPFWFIQLSNGTIPEIRFLKQDTNLNIKNWKKYLLSLLQNNINVNNNQTMETNWFGSQPVQTLKISNISNNNRILNKLEKHIENFTDNNNNDNDDTNQSPITTINSNQTIHFDRQHIIDSCM